MCWLVTHKIHRAYERKLHARKIRKDYQSGVEPDSEQEKEYHKIDLSKWGSTEEEDFEDWTIRRQHKKRGTQAVTSRIADNTDRGTP